MSAFNCFLTPDAAHVFTDGAIYDGQTVEVKGFASKVMPIPQYNAVLGATGFHWVALLLAGAFAESSFDNFDELAAAFSNIVKRYGEQSKKAGLDMGNFIAGLAGWSSKTDAPVFLSVRGFDDRGVPAFQAVPSTKFLNPAAAFEGDDSITRLKFDRDRPAESGLEIMRAQRAKRFVLVGSSDHRSYLAIGGFCQHTVVTRDSITTRVLERWSDQIGKQIMLPLPVRASPGTFGRG